MSRIAKKPIPLVSGVSCTQSDGIMTVKGAKGQMSYPIPQGVIVDVEATQLQVRYPEGSSSEVVCHAGSTRAHLANMVEGVTKGFERKLVLIGVGYRAQAQGKVLNLTLGFSHPVAYELPEGVVAETPSQTEIILKGMSKQKVGEAAAKICRIRKFDWYKGKGIRPDGLKVKLKETKKK